MLNSLRENYVVDVEMHAPKTDKEYVFAGYKVTTKGKDSLSIEGIHQIQQIALLLNAYESFKSNKEGEIQVNYYVEGIDGATIISSANELEKGEMVGIEVNSVLSFYKVKNIGKTVTPKGYPIMNKEYETVELKGEHKIVNGDERDISGLVRGQKYHTRGKLFEVLKNKNGVMDVAPLDFTLVERILMSEDK